MKILLFIFSFTAVTQVIGFDDEGFFGSMDGTSQIESRGTQYPSYTQQDLESCPFSQRSANVNQLVENSISLLDSLNSEECEALDRSAIERVKGRFKDLQRHRDSRRDYDGMIGGDQVDITGRSGNVSCVNYKQTYKMHFNIAINYVKEDLDIPSDNLFFSDCGGGGYDQYGMTMSTPFAEEETISASEENKFQCLDKALGSKLKSKEIACEGQVEEELAQLESSSILEMSNLLGQVVAGNCSDGNNAIKESVFNVATDYLSLVGFAYPGIAVGAITNIIAPLVSQRENPLEKLKKQRQFEQVQCMHLALEKARCSNNRPAYNQWKLNKDEPICYKENIVGIPNNVLELASAASVISKDSSAKQLLTFFEGVDNTNFFNVFNNAKNYIFENAETDLNTSEKLYESFNQQEQQNNSIYQTLRKAYETYKSNSGKNKLEIIRDIKKDLASKSAEDSFNFNSFFSAYADMKIKNEKSSEVDLERFRFISNLATFEGNRLSNELQQVLDADIKINDQRVLNGTLAAFVGKTKDLFVRDLKDQGKSLKRVLKNYRSDGYSETEKDQIFSNLGAIIRTCKLSTSMFYLDSGRSSFDEMFSKGSFDGPYEDICGQFPNCISRKKDNFSADLEGYNNFICSNTFDYNLDSIKDEFDTKGTFCGRKLNDIRKSL